VASKFLGPGCFGIVVRGKSLQGVATVPIEHLGLLAPRHRDRYDPPTGFGLGKSRQQVILLLVMATVTNGMIPRRPIADPCTLMNHDREGPDAGNPSWNLARPAG
jgi:hypothetical protein